MKTISKKNRFQLNPILVTALTLVAFGLRLYNLGWRSLWYDELLQADIAQGALNNIWPQLAQHAAMPLDYYLLHGWLRLAHQDFWARWPALFFGVLAIPLIYALAARLFNRRVGLLAAALLTVASFAIQYSQEVRPYALLLVLTLTGHLSLWQAYATHHQRYWGLVLLSIIGAVLTHYFALFMLLPMGLFVVIQQLRHLKQTKFWRQTAYFTLCLLLLLAVLISTGHFKFLYNVSFGLTNAMQQPTTLTQAAAEKPNGGSGPPFELSFFVDQVFSPLASSTPALLLLYNFFFLAAALSLLRRRHKQRAAILLLLGWLILPILLVYFFLLQRGTFYAIRYILYTLPAYLTLVAYGVDIFASLITNGMQILFSHTVNRARNLFHLNINGTRNLFRPLFFQTIAWPKLFIFTLLLFMPLPLLKAEVDELQQYYTAATREDWRAVGQLLRNHASPNDALIAVKAEPAINWYYPPATAPFNTYSHSQSIWQAINEHPRRWFILSSYSQKQDKGLRDWLRNNQAVTIGIDRRVVVYLQQEGLTAEELLAEVKTFMLPHKAITYVTLARQLERSGDVETSRMFYQKALELADPELRDIVEAQIAVSLVWGH